MPLERKDLVSLIGASESGLEPTHDPTFKEKRFKFSGFGGQGVLSLGLVVAEAAGKAGRFVSWFPSYGPEQRGGSASCSVVMGGKEIGSPTVDNPDVLVAMNQPSLERFLPTVAKGGVVLYDASIPLNVQIPEGVKALAFPAMKVASEAGVPKAANTALLGALSQLGLLGVPEDVVLTALAESFAEKPALVEKNRKVYEAAKTWAASNLK
jgi:2-oxoisovalerate ferredoxin oxidoreductase beta subunit